MEIKVGEYVRTPLGISKYLGECDDMPNFYKFDKLDEELWFSDIADVIYQNQLDEVILKHSPNIIDLIEVGDYVNGYKVIDIVKSAKVIVTDLELDTTTGTYVKKGLKNIETIVTREQFKRMEYVYDRARIIRKDKQSK